MSRAISKDSFDELKNYLGVYLQQGRVILDSDWNENQDIAVASGRRLSHEALGEGSPNKGFAIESLNPGAIGYQEFIGHSLMFFLNFPGKLLDDFESADGWQLSSPLGSIRINHDQPYEGNGFLRVSGHPGTVQLTRTLPRTIDLSAAEFVTFRYRVNQPGRGVMKFFVEDSSGNRSVWLIQDPAIAQDFWLGGCAGPLDLRLRILTTALPRAKKDENYLGRLTYVGGKQPVTPSISAGALPAGLTLVVSPPSASSPGRVTFGAASPSANGVFTFTVQLIDAAGKIATQNLSLTVAIPNPQVFSFLPLDDSVEALPGFIKAELPSTDPADLTRIQRYGFEIYQDSANPLVWDFDSLRLGSNSLYDQIAANNFVIRGSSLARFRNQLNVPHFAKIASGQTFNPIDFSSFASSLSEPGIENAGRMHVAGLKCTQIDDGLYSAQADPNDPVLAPPPAGAVRKDLVYLDVWQEPVTYVEDPEIREVALGGPDTSTRLRTRSRVRVIQGSGTQPGVLPANRGVGKGTLASEGSYTGTANRLYRIEIDTPGDINTATFRWSDDNASTIQRVIQSVPPGSTRVVVEDTSAFRPGDQILLSKEFGSEQHVIASISGNAITLANPTGAQLGALPANGRIADFTTFAVGDRPRIQRWNALKVPVKADTTDPTISAAILLNDGVQVRFGGRAMASGDYWNFRTRFLAGDELSGLNTSTRIEQLRFRRPRGVFHHYSPLALITRNGSDLKPDQIVNVQDRRQRIGNTNTTAATFFTGPVFNARGEQTSNQGSPLLLFFNKLQYAGGLAIPRAAADSRFLIYWTGDLSMSSAPSADCLLEVRASLFNDAMGDPRNDDDTGRVREQKVLIPLANKAVSVEIPLSLLFPDDPGNDPFAPSVPPPTSAQFYLTCITSATGSFFTLKNMHVTVIEMKKGF